LIDQKPTEINPSHDEIQSWFELQDSKFDYNTAEHPIELKIELLTTETCIRCS
jgi:hypothetical protein